MTKLVVRAIDGFGVMRVELPCTLGYRCVAPVSGRTAPYPRGGDRRSGRIDRAQRRERLAWSKVEETARTSHSTRPVDKALLKERDLSVKDRHGVAVLRIAMEISFKKKPRTPPRQERPDRRRAPFIGPGSRANPISIPAGWCSSTETGALDQNGPACVAARSARSGRCTCRDVATCPH